MIGSTPKVSSTKVLDRFFAQHYYDVHPVNATFTGVHDYDDVLPDWSLDALLAVRRTSSDMQNELERAYPTLASPDADLNTPELLDARLAFDFLEIECAEMAPYGGEDGDAKHGPRGNPALWTGEAVFSIVSLLHRNFAPPDERAESMLARLTAIPWFLGESRTTLAEPGRQVLPEAWIARALRDCAGGAILFSRGVDRWLRAEGVNPELANGVSSAASKACAAMAGFADWLRRRTPAPASVVACGPSYFELLLECGHQCRRTPHDLLTEARERFAEARALRDESARRLVGSWPAVQEALARDHVSPHEYLAAFDRISHSAREAGADVVTWPAGKSGEWPIRYVTYPEWISEAAPFLCYPHYRSPAPFDEDTIHDYVVPALPAGDPTDHLHAWNTSVMKLDHVIRNGGIGHHVQNWHAARQRRSRIGAIAAVHGANRIGMLCGGTMAEGWATYATGLMNELGFLTPLEQVADQHTTVQMLGRAIVDIELHHGTMSLDEAERFYRDEVGMSAPAARTEVVKSSMFPTTGIMCWLGVQGIRDLRAQLERKRGRDWSLKTFHDELLSFGSIPVSFLSRLLAG